MFLRHGRRAATTAVRRDPAALRAARTRTPDREFRTRPVARSQQSRCRAAHRPPYPSSPQQRRTASTASGRRRCRDRTGSARSTPSDRGPPPGPSAQRWAVTRRRSARHRWRSRRGQPPPDRRPTRARTPSAAGAPPPGRERQHRQGWHAPLRRVHAPRRPAQGAGNHPTSRDRAPTCRRRRVLQSRRRRQHRRAGSDRPRKCPERRCRPSSRSSAQTNRPRNSRQPELWPPTMPSVCVPPQRNHLTTQRADQNAIDCVAVG